MIVGVYKNTIWKSSISNPRVQGKVRWVKEIAAENLHCLKHGWNCVQLLRP